MEARIRMREEPAAPPANADGGGCRCGRRPCSPLAGLLFLATVASMASIATLLYWQPSILSSGLGCCSKGPLVGLADWIPTGSEWARVHARPFWGGFAGAVVLLMVLWRGMRQACCRRLLFFLTALATAPIAWTVVHSQWPAITELVRGARQF